MRCYFLCNVTESERILLRQGASNVFAGVWLDGIGGGRRGGGGGGVESEDD